MTSDYRNQNAESRECYGQQEILEALRGFSEEAITQVRNFARFRLMGQTARVGHQIEVEDLFIDAAIRTMEQKRRWKRGVSPFNHFLAVMRSIGHQRLKQASRYAPLSDLIADTPKWNLSTLDAKTSVARLKAQLRGDRIALNILESMMNETRPRDAQQSLGMSAKVYWAARKRIRRQAEAVPGACGYQRRLTAAKVATDSMGASTGRARVPTVEAKKGMR